MPSLVKARGLVQYSKKNIGFPLPSMVDREIIAQESTHNPLKVNICSLKDAVFDRVLRRSSLEFIGCARHLWIETLKLLGALQLGYSTRVEGQCERHRT